MKLQGRATRLKVGSLIGLACSTALVKIPTAEATGDLNVNYVELNQQAELLSPAERALGLTAPGTVNLSDNVPRILSSCFVGLLTPTYRVTNVLLTQYTNVNTPLLRASASRPYYFGRFPARATSRNT